MESNNSGKFFVGSLVIIGVLVFVVNLILNSMLSLADGVLPPPKMDDDAISERLAPVAQERIGEEPIVEAAAVEVSDDAGAADAGPGQQIFTAVCAMCHNTGLMQSPKLGSKEDWAPRIEKGIETLYDHALNGFKAMPARGGNASLSDDDVKAAVDYMVSKAQ